MFGGKLTCIDQAESAHATKEKVAMSVTMDDSIKRWTARRKTALVVEIIQGKTTVAAASRAFDLSPSEIEGWVEDAKRGMDNALRANSLDIREQYEKQVKDLQEA
jgi:transposase-like protein